MQPELRSKAAHLRRVIGNASGAFAAFVLLLGVGFSLLAVLSRYQIASGLSLALPDEAARGSLGWLTFVGAASVIRDRSYLRFELLDPILPGAVLGFRQVLFDLGLLILTCYVAWLSWDVVLTSLRVSLVSIEAPKAIFSSALFIGFVIQAIMSALWLWDDLHSFFAARPSYSGFSQEGL